MATSVWKGHLTFGLISIPIRLFSAARSERISLNQLHAECHTRIRMPLFCPTHNRIVERSEIVKGYEYEKDQYVLFTEEDLDKIDPPSAQTMEILEFVKIDEVDPLYFDASYYVTPEEAGKKAYHLLIDAMQESGYVAIAKLTMHQRENIVIMRPRANGLTLHTMFYANEIRQVAEYGQPDSAPLKEQEKKLAYQLIESLAAPFDPSKYHDEYQTSLKALIEAKLKGQDVAAAPHPKLAPVIDLMDALKKSLAEKPAPAMKPPVRAMPAPAQAAATATTASAAPAQKKRRKSAG
jgi:DNA end-binding protein Ku